MPSFTPILSLGDFDFVSFEEPESVTFGKEQATYKHILIGGGRVIDCLGAGDPDINWNGYLTGFQAEDRARYLENLADKGEKLKLKTSSFIKTVVIQKFAYDFQFVYPIPYRITVQVVEDDTKPVTTQVLGDLTLEILGTIIEAQEIASLLENPSINSALALLLAAAQAGAPFVDNTSINATLSAAFNAQAAIGAAIAAASANL